MSSPPQSAQLAPFRIDPVFTPRVWGSRDLRPWFDRFSEDEPIGEVWLTGDDCLISTGAHAGKRLAELFSAMPESLLGPGAPSPESPLLVKVLFAREKLSVQVHPDDALARKHGQPRGKAECWYALAAEPGAQVACGLKRGTTLDRIKEQIRAGTLESSLNVLPVAPGEMIFVDAGTVHAIWPGSILLETQQNCDLTYRMYDYGRPRELHIEPAIEATKLHTRAGKVAPREERGRTVLLDANYFRVERIPVPATCTSLDLSGAAVGSAAAGSGGAQPSRQLAYLFAAAGQARISAPESGSARFEPVDLPARGIVAVPAASPEFVLENAGGLDLIRITPNWITPDGIARN